MASQKNSICTQFFKCSSNSFFFVSDNDLRITLDCFKESLENIGEGLFSLMKGEDNAKRNKMLTRTHTKENTYFPSIFRLKVSVLNHLKGEVETNCISISWEFLPHLIADCNEKLWGSILLAFLFWKVNIKTILLELSNHFSDWEFLPTNTSQQIVELLLVDSKLRADDSFETGRGNDPR